MKKMMTQQEMEASLDKMPILKQLLINYILFIYEEAAETDNWHLVQEYLLLKKKKQLNLLFVQELFDNTYSFESSKWL